MARPIRFNAVLSNAGPRPGAATGTRLHSLETWTDLAQILEQARFDLLSIAPAPEGVPSAADPFQVVAAMSFVTDHLGFAVPGPARIDEAEAFADRLVSAHRLSDGRVAWSLASAATAEEADGREALAAAVRAALADGVPDAAPGLPLVHRTETAEDWRIAGRHADVAHLAGRSAAEARGAAAAVRGYARDAGRDPGAVRIHAPLAVFVADTDAAAAATVDAYHRTGRLAPGAPLAVGAADTVADRIEALARATDVDGFDLTAPLVPDGYDDVLELLVPELVRRGLHREEYGEVSLAARLRGAAPAPRPGAARVVRLVDRAALA